MGPQVTRDTWEYKVPCSLDIPLQFNTTLLPGAPAPHAFLGAKATGEPPVCLAAAVLFAIKQAVAAARAHGPAAAGGAEASGDGASPWFRLDAPASCDRVRNLCPAAESW